MPALTRIYRNPKVLESHVTLPGYEGELRQFTVMELGHGEPTILLTNHRKLGPVELVTRSLPMVASKSAPSWRTERNKIDLRQTSSPQYPAQRLRALRDLTKPDPCAVEALDARSRGAPHARTLPEAVFRRGPFL